MSDTYLTKEELIELTDRQLPSKQIDWLKRYGWKFAVSAAGHPKVARTYHEFRLGSVATEPQGTEEPDFSRWIEKSGGK